MPDYGASGEKKGDIWVKSGGIGGGNSRKPVFGFRLSKEGLFCKGLNILKKPANIMFVGFLVSTVLRMLTVRFRTYN